jgi:hypothetical protein
MLAFMHICLILTEQGSVVYLAAVELCIGYVGLLDRGRIRCVLVSGKTSLQTSPSLVDETKKPL